MYSLLCLKLLRVATSKTISKSSRNKTSKGSQRNKFRKQRGEKKLQPSQLARFFCCSFDICAPTILKVTLKPLLADGGWRGGSGRPSASAQSIRFVQDALHVFNDREFQAPLQPGFHSTAWTQRRGHICARVEPRSSHLS